MKKKHCLRFAGVVTFGLVAICGLGIGLAQNADAITCSTYSAKGFACATSTTVKATIASYITVSLQNSVGGTNYEASTGTIAVSVTPGTLNTDAYTRITVSTNTTKGYTLKVHDADDDTSLSTGTGNSIPANGNISETASDQFGWAIRISSCGTAANKSCLTTGQWNAMKTESEGGLQLATNNSSTTITNDVTTVQYGVRTSITQAAGTYADAIVYTATVNG